MRRRVGFQLLLLLMMLLAPQAGAQETSPGELFQAGKRAFAQKRYTEAAQLFERANELSPTAHAAFNAGEAWDAAQESARAANAFAQALDLGDLPPKLKQTAAQRLSQLSLAVARVSLSGPPRTVVRTQQREFPIPAVIYLEPGVHQLRASFSSGQSTVKELQVGAGQVLLLELKLPDTPAAHPTDKVPGTARPPRRRPVPPDQAPQTAGDNTQTVVGWTALGVAAAAVGAGVYFNVRGIRENDRFEDSGRSDSETHDRAIRFRTLSFVSYGAGAVIGGMGLFLILSEDGNGTTAVSTHGPSVQLTRRF